LVRRGSRAAGPLVEGDAGEAGEILDRDGREAAGSEVATQPSPLSRAALSQAALSWTARAADRAGRSAAVRGCKCVAGGGGAGQHDAGHLAKEGQCYPRPCSEVVHSGRLLAPSWCPAEAKRDSTLALSHPRASVPSERGAERLRGLR